jgi:hypothetical protein
MLQTKLHADGDQMVVENVQDCTPIVELAQALHKEGRHGSNEFRHAAKIPDVVIQIYLNKHNIEFSEFMQNKAHIRAMLNDPDLRNFRIWPGRV